jgi:hypothetical protein
MMSDSIRVVGRRSRALRRVLRSAAAVIGTAGLALLAAACGASTGSHVAQLGSTATQSSSSSNPSASSPAQTNGAVAFAHCMRAHGVPSYPDPTSGGQLVKESVQQLGVSSARFQAASRVCNHLLPNGSSGPSSAQVQYARALALRFSPCMRAHGVPSFPDPGSDGRIPDPASLGIEQGSPKFQTANQACRKYRPPYMPSNAAYNSYARTHGS